MRKLYKTINGRVRYWTAWERDGELFVHTGWLGHGGKQEKHVIPSGEPEHAAIARVAVPIIAEGYEPIDDTELHMLVIQKALATWGNPDDVTTRSAIEAVANRALGRTGNGYCTGVDIGSGTINVFCSVVEPPLAVKTLVTELRKARLLADVTIAYSTTATLSGKVRVGHPPRRRKFSILGAPAPKRRTAPKAAKRVRRRTRAR